MALDSAALPPDAQAPIVDTPEAPAENTAGNTPTPPQPVDWEARYKSAQAELTRIAQGNARRARDLAEASAAEEGDEPEEGEAPAPRPRGRISAREEAALERVAILERQVAESVHGPEALTAYDSLVDMWNGAETESDRVTAALAFADLVRSAAPQPPAPAAQGALPTREQATAPRVDDNRSDVPPSDLDPKQFEGGANGGARGYFKQQLERLTGQS